jgi:hypothetical protein
MIDHRCRNTLCVNPGHLRPVNNSQNQQNRQGATRQSKSGIRGVFWDKRRNAWVAHATKQGVTKRIQCRTVEEAEATARLIRNSLFTHNEADR